MGSAQRGTGALRGRTEAGRRWPSEEMVAQLIVELAAPLIGSTVELLLPALAGIVEKWCSSAWAGWAAGGREQSPVVGCAGGVLVECHGAGDSSCAAEWVAQPFKKKIVQIIRFLHEDS